LAVAGGLLEQAERPGGVVGQQGGTALQLLAIGVEVCLLGRRQGGDRLREAHRVAAIGRDQTADEPGAPHDVRVLGAAVEHFLGGAGCRAEIADAIGGRCLHQDQLRRHRRAPPIELASSLACRGDGAFGVACLHLRQRQIIGDVADGAGVVALVGTRKRHLVLLHCQTRQVHRQGLCSGLVGLVQLDVGWRTRVSGRAAAASGEGHQREH
jgi:hypothetical protein